MGDQVLSIDDTIIENSAYSPDEVMTMLDANTGRGYTQMQIMPAHALTRRGTFTHVIYPVSDSAWTKKSMAACCVCDSCLLLALFTLSHFDLLSCWLFILPLFVSDALTAERRRFVDVL